MELIKTKDRRDKMDQEEHNEEDEAKAVKEEESVKEQKESKKKKGIGTKIIIFIIIIAIGYFIYSLFAPENEIDNTDIMGMAQTAVSQSLTSAYENGNTLTVLDLMIIPKSVEFSYNYSDYKVVDLGKVKNGDIKYKVSSSVVAKTEGGASVPLNYETTIELNPEEPYNGYTGKTNFTLPPKFIEDFVNASVN